MFDTVKFEAMARNYPGHIRPVVNPKALLTNPSFFLISPYSYTRFFKFYNLLYSYTSFSLKFHNFPYSYTYSDYI